MLILDVQLCKSYVDKLIQKVVCKHPPVCRLLEVVDCSWVTVTWQVETECRGRLRLLNAALGELESFDAGVNQFDSWLSGAECQLRIMQRSVGDLHKFRQQTTHLQVTDTYILNTYKDTSVWWQCLVYVVRHLTVVGNTKVRGVYRSCQATLMSHVLF